MTLDEVKQLKVGDWVQYKGWQNWRIQSKSKTFFTLVREDNFRKKVMLIKELVNEDYQVYKLSHQQVYDQGQDPWTASSVKNYGNGITIPKEAIINNASIQSSEPIFRKVGWHKDHSETKTCTHQWQQYVGLNETFEFCVKCDCKREGKS